MDVKKTIFDLSNLYGPSGFEAPVTEFARKLLAEYTDETYVDALGNLFGVKRCGKPNAKKLLLDAHLDEIGMVITGQEKGFLRFARIANAIDQRMLPAREVTVLADEPFQGVVTCLPPHVQTAAEMSEAMPEDKMFIDAGLTEEQAKLIPLGTPVAFSGTVCELQNSAISGKSMDDRACFTTLLRTMELLKEKELDIDIVVMGSVQEETGLRGATAGVFSIAPDYAVAVDVTHAETPDASPDETFKFKGGPTIGYGPSMNRKMSKAFTALANENDIPCQTEVMARSSGTNGWAFQVSREGVPSAVLSVPLRYMHTPCETLALDDIENTAKLLALFCENTGRWM